MQAPTAPKPTADELARKLERSTDREGSIVVHPHEALQAIAVELSQANRIAAAQLKVSQAAVGEMHALRQMMERANQGGSDTQREFLQMMSATLPQLLSLFTPRAAPAAVETQIEAAPAQPAALAAPSRTARIEQKPASVQEL